MTRSGEIGDWKRNGEREINSELKKIESYEARGIAPGNEIRSFADFKLAFIRVRYFVFISFLVLSAFFFIYPTGMIFTKGFGNIFVYLSG